MCLLATAGEDGRDPVNAGKLCFELINSYPKRLRMSARSELYWDDDGRPRVRVNSRLPLLRAKESVCHELSHWHLWATRRDRIWDLEQRCDAIAAAMAAPRPLVKRAFHEFGLDFVAIARVMRCTQSTAILRLAECERIQAAALQTERRIIARGSWGMVAEEEMQKIIRRGADGVLQVLMTDHPGRMGIIVL